MNKNLPDLPIVTGETLRPKLLGVEHFYKTISCLLAGMPNLSVLKRHRLQAGPVPQPFVYHHSSTRRQG